MSVGLQRLRDDADAIRIGARDKGEDVALVDQALALDADRRRVLGDVESLRAERKQVSAEVGAAMKAGGAGADDLRAESVEIGSRIEAGEERLRAMDGRARGPAAPHPKPSRSGRAGRPAGGDADDPRMGRARCARRRRLGAQAALGDRREPRACSTSRPAPR